MNLCCELGTNCLKVAFQDKDIFVKFLKLQELDDRKKLLLKLDLWIS